MNYAVALQTEVKRYWENPSKKKENIVLNLTYFKMADPFIPHFPPKCSPQEARFIPEI